MILLFRLFSLGSSHLVSGEGVEANDKITLKILSSYETLKHYLEPQSEDTQNIPSYANRLNANVKIVTDLDNSNHRCMKRKIL